MGFSFNRISDFFVLVVVLVVVVVQEVLHERGFSELRASRAKKARLSSPYQKAWLGLPKSKLGPNTSVLPFTKY